MFACGCRATASTKPGRPSRCRCPTARALRRLGLRAAGGNHKTLKHWVGVWDIPTGHFDPYGSQRRGGAYARGCRPLAEVMVEDSTFSRSQLKERLYREGLKARRCELCGQGEEWRGRRMGLILHHINGVADDHRLENLQIVCPNCAATLDTHCGRQNRRLRRCRRCDAEFLPRTASQTYCTAECGRRAPPRAGPRPATRKVARDGRMIGRWSARRRPCCVLAGEPPTTRPDAP